MRRIILALLLALLAAQTALGDTQARYWTVSHRAQSAMEARVASWNEAHPQERIDLITSVFSGDQIDLKLWTALHSGVLVPGLEPPDLADIDYICFEKYVNPLNCLLYPLGDSKDDPFAYRGMLFGMAQGGCEVRCVYDAALLANACVLPESIDSWADFEGAGRALYAATGKPMLGVDMDGYLVFLTAAARLGAPGFEMNDTLYGETLTTLARLFDEGVLTMMPGGREDSKTFRRAFRNGEIGCALVRSEWITEFGEEIGAGKVVYPLPEGAISIPGYATAITTSCADYDLLSRFLRWENASGAALPEGAISPGNAQSLVSYVERYELELARRVLKP